jgi:hypothetical protein
MDEIEQSLFPKKVGENREKKESDEKWGWHS